VETSQKPLNIISNAPILPGLREQNVRRPVEQLLACLRQQETRLDMNLNCEALQVFVFGFLLDGRREI